MCRAQPHKPANSKLLHPPLTQTPHPIQHTHTDFVPPLGKGALYLRPLLLGSGPILGLGPAPSYTFTIYAAAVGSYFKVGVGVVRVRARCLACAVREVARRVSRTASSPSCLSLPGHIAPDALCLSH